MTWRVTCADRRMRHYPGSQAAARTSSINRKQCCQLFQHFPARMTKKFRPLRKKLGPLQIQYLQYHFIKIRQNFEIVLELKSVKIPVFQCFRMEKIKETKHFQNLAPFRSLLGKSGQNSAADLSGRLHFYPSSFELCGRIIGQLGTLAESSPQQGV